MLECFTVHYYSLCFALQAASQLVSIFEDPLLVHSGLPSREDLWSVLYHHLLQMRCNTHTVMAMDRQGTSDDLTDEIAEQRIGEAVYLTASLFNHSCDPNVFFRQVWAGLTCFLLVKGGRS